MYRRIFSTFRYWYYHSRTQRYIYQWFNHNQWTRKIQHRYYASPLLALAGISIKDYNLDDEDMRNEAKATEYDEKHIKQKNNKWEPLVEENDVRVYRRRIPGDRELYEYRCSGTYYDITPKHFVDAQCDVEYRREWDQNVISLEVLESDEQTDTQVVRWIAKFPYPMYPRAYIYIRRKIVDFENGKIIVSSRALDENLYPNDSKYVRVNWYRSSMLIQAHKSFDEQGLDYVLTYYDDPQANIPTVAYNWIVNRGGPYFLKQVHQAAKKLENCAQLKTNDKINVMKRSQTSTELSNDSESTVEMSGSIPNYQAA